MDICDFNVIKKKRERGRGGPRSRLFLRVDESPLMVRYESLKNHNKGLGLRNGKAKERLRRDGTI